MAFPGARPQGLGGQLSGPRGSASIRPPEGADACEECGSTRRSQGVLGLSVCSDCGSVSTFAGDLKAVSREDFKLPAMKKGGALCPVPAPMRVESLPRHYKYSQELLRADSRRAHRVQRCKAAIVLLSDALQLQTAIHEPATNLLVRHCQRTNGIPKALARLKRLVAACILAVGIRQGLGITINEVAARAGIGLGEVQKAAWRVCKVNGLRLWRGPQNVESLLVRICEHFQLNRQRASVIATAVKIVTIAHDGWIATGRMWAFVVAAAFVLAAQAYHYRVDVDALGRMLAGSEGTIRVRLQEISKLMLSMLRLLPWGKHITPRNMHAYVLFVVDFWDIIVPVAPELRRRQLDEIHLPSAAALGDAGEEEPRKRKRLKEQPDPREDPLRQLEELSLVQEVRADPSHASPKRVPAQETKGPSRPPEPRAPAPEAPPPPKRLRRVATSTGAGQAGLLLPAGAGGALVGAANLDPGSSPLPPTSSASGSPPPRPLPASPTSSLAPSTPRDAAPASAGASGAPGRASLSPSSRRARRRVRVLE